MRAKFREFSSTFSTSKTLLSRRTEDGNGAITIGLRTVSARALIIINFYYSQRPIETYKNREVKTYKNRAQFIQ